MRITINKFNFLFLFTLLIWIFTGCEKKADASFSAEQNISQPVIPILEIPFLDILDNYFKNNDNSLFLQCVDKIVTHEEMRIVSEKYGSSGHIISFNKKMLYSIVSRSPKNDTTSGKKVLYSIDGIKREDGLANYLIFDIISLEGREGNYLSVETLYEGQYSDLRFQTSVPNYFGIMEYIFNERRPLGTPIFPKWIVTANEEGKIIVTEPLDNKWYIFFPNVQD
ncbi:MAG: hypothetical protein FWH35_03335 [Treponema sp.]|nr:hypothetical protein [Treponema sp.]